MSTAETTNRLLTVAEASVELRVSRATAYRLVESGEIPAVKLGGSIRIPAAEMHALLETTHDEEKR